MAKPVPLSRAQSRGVGPYGYRASILHRPCCCPIVSIVLALIAPTWRWEDYGPPGKRRSTDRRVIPTPLPI